MAEGTNRWLVRLLYMQAALRASAIENLKCKIDFFIFIFNATKKQVQHITPSGIKVEDLKENGIIFLLHIVVANDIYVQLADCPQSRQPHQSPCQSSKSFMFITQTIHHLLSTKKSKTGELVGVFFFIFKHLIDLLLLIMVRTWP